MKLCKKLRKIFPPNPMSSRHLHLFPPPPSSLPACRRGRSRSTLSTPRPPYKSQSTNIVLPLLSPYSPQPSSEVKSNNMASRHCLRVAYLLMLSLVSFILSPALGFKCACSCSRQMASSSHRALSASTPRVRVLPSLNALFMSMTSNQPRAAFLYKCLISPLVAATPSVAHAFDGGVGGLGM